MSTTKKPLVNIYKNALNFWPVARMLTGMALVAGVASTQSGTLRHNPQRITGEPEHFTYRNPISRTADTFTAALVKLTI